MLGNCSKVLHTFHFNVCLLYLSKTVHCSTHKDLFSCCPVAGRAWEATGTEELGCALLWVLLSLFMIFIIEQHKHILPGDTQDTLGPVMEQGSWWEPFECLQILCTVPEATREQKSTMFPPRMWQNRRAQLKLKNKSCWLATTNWSMWSPMLPWGFPLTLLPKSKAFTTLCIDLETGSR